TTDPSWRTSRSSRFRPCPRRPGHLPAAGTGRVWQVFREGGCLPPLSPQGLRITLGAVGKMAMLFPFKPAAGCWPSAAAVLCSSAARLPSGVFRMDSPQSLSLAHHFRDLPDPRLARLCKHDFLDILTNTVCAVICGQHTWTDIELYGETHHDWLKTFLRLPHSIPAPDTSPSLPSPPP